MRVLKITCILPSNRYTRGGATYGTSNKDRLYLTMQCLKSHILQDYRFRKEPVLLLHVSLDRETVGPLLSNLYYTLRSGGCTITIPKRVTVKIVDLRVQPSKTCG